MANGKTQASEIGESVDRHSGVSEDARSTALALRGLSTTDAMSKFLGAIVSDILEGKVPPKVANPVVVATGKMLKSLELKHRYGSGKDLKVF